MDFKLKIAPTGVNAPSNLINVADLLYRSPLLVCGYRHRFFEDVEELKAQERASNSTKRMEILERRQRQIEEVAEKKRGSS